MENKEDIEQAEEGNIIDVEPEAPETPEFKDSADSSANNKSSTVQLPLILAIVAIVAFLITGALGYRYWSNMASELITIQQRINNTLSDQQKLVGEIANARKVLQEHSARISEQESQASSQNDQLAAEKETLTKQAEAMQQAVDEINSKVGRTDNQWQIAEAEYLLRVANHQLMLNHDVKTAITALKQADEKLRSSGDLGLIKVREQVAGEINALKAVNIPDITGIASTLQALSQQVPNLKLAGTTLSRAERDNSAKSSEPSERSFDTLLEDSWNGFRELVVIRKHDKPISAMLPPSQQFFLFQNLQLQLETARLSLLRQEIILFKSSLDTTTEWLNSFFDINEPATANMLETLDELKQQSFKTELPNISESLNLLIQHQGQSL